jgi:hypothetical protein
MKKAEILIPTHFPGLDMIVCYDYEEVQEDRMDVDDTEGMMYVVLTGLELVGEKKGEYMCIGPAEIPTKLANILASAVHKLHHEQNAEKHY